MGNPITYIEMCSLVASEVGANGGSVSSVENQEGDALFIVNAVRQADLYVQSLHFDWDFLWMTKAGDLTQGSNLMPRASDLNFLDRKSVILNKGLSRPHFPKYLEWGDFLKTFESHVYTNDLSNDGDNDPTPNPDLTPLPESDSPGWFSIKPNQSDAFRLSSLIKSQGIRYYYEYWKRPVALVQNSNPSAINTFDIETQRIIISKAKMLWAAEQDAPEIMADSEQEFEQMLSRLKAASHRSNSEQEYRHVPDVALAISAE